MKIKKVNQKDKNGTTSIDKTGKEKNYCDRKKAYNTDGGTDPGRAMATEEKYIIPFLLCVGLSFSYVRSLYGTLLP